MASSCLGTFGTYQYMVGDRIKSNIPRSASAIEDGKLGANTVWVTKRYIPTDLRSTAPVPRHKPIAPGVQDLPQPADYWMPPRQASLGMFSRKHEEDFVYASQPSTRCESWSTLRQMLPSIGRPDPSRPANWGTGSALPPIMTDESQRRFPHINSPMTRYIDDMHQTNRLFKLH